MLGKGVGTQNSAQLEPGRTPAPQDLVGGLDYVGGEKWGKKWGKEERPDDGTRAGRVGH